MEVFLLSNKPGNSCSLPSHRRIKCDMVFDSGALSGTSQETESLRSQFGIGRSCGNMASSWACARTPLCETGYFFSHTQARTIAMPYFKSKDQYWSALRIRSARARFSTAERYRSQEDMDLHARNLLVTQQFSFGVGAHSHSCCRPEMPAPFQSPTAKPAE